MVFGVQRHAVVSFAFSDWIPSNDLVRCRINDGENVLVLQVDIHPARDGVVLGHSRFTVEMQRLDDFVLGHIHNRFRFAPLGRDVELMKGSRVSAAIRFGFGLQFLDDFHLLQVHNADRVVVRVRGIELLEFGHIFHSLGAGRIGNRRDNFVRAEIDDVRLVSGKMRG